DAKLTGRRGPRPIGHPAVYAFSTPTGVEAVGRHCVEGEYADGCELGPITVDFTAPITRAQAKHLRISPKPRGFDTLAVAREYDDDGRGRDAYHEVMLWGEFQRGQSYAITVDEQLRDIYGQPLVGEPSFEVAFIEPPPILKLHKAAGTFSSTHGFEVGIESRY